LKKLEQCSTLIVNRFRKPQLLFLFIQLTYNFLASRRYEFGFNDTSDYETLLANINGLEFKNFPRGNSYTGRAIEFAGSLFENIAPTADSPQPTRVSLFR